MPTVKRYIGQTVAVMTECNRLVKVEFSEVVGGGVELTLVKAGTFERVKGFSIQSITAADYKGCPWEASAKSAWAVKHFGLKVKGA